MCFEELKQRLLEGIDLRQGRLYLAKVSQGRFLEEENYTIHLNREGLLLAKVFYGRKPYYKEWVELFNMEEGFFGTEAEDLLLELFSRCFRRIFCGVLQRPTDYKRVKKWHSTPRDQARQEVKKFGLHLF